MSKESNMLNSNSLRHTATAQAMLLLATVFTFPVAAGERSIDWQGTGYYVPADFPLEPEIRLGGNATHLGDCLLRIWCDPEPLLYDQHDLVPVDMIFRCSSDDTLYGSVDDHAFDPTTGMMIISMHFSGGTGRFADATGNAELLIVFDNWLGGYLQAISVWSLNGTLNY